MIFTIFCLLMYSNTLHSLECFSKWPFDNATYTTDLTYCQSALSVYERQQLSEREIYDVYQPNVCETTVRYSKMCAFVVARVTDRGATNVLICCCRSNLCNALSMSKEYEEKLRLAPVCADNRAMDNVTKKKAVYSPFCYQKLLFDHSDERNGMMWRLRKQEMGPDSQGSNPTKAGYFGCGTGISSGECALTRFYATPMNHLLMISEEDEAAFICCCNRDYCNADIPINKCWSVYRALDFNESNVIPIHLCSHSPKLSSWWSIDQSRISRSTINRKSISLQFTFLVVLANFHITI